MTQRYEDLPDTELRTQVEELSSRIDELDIDGDGAPEELVEQWAQADRELSRRDALAARKSGHYSVTLDADGQEIEYELKARTLEDAEAEAQSGVEAMTRMSGRAVTIERYNTPIGEGE